jgi:hypothetical protein
MRPDASVSCFKQEWMYGGELEAGELVMFGVGLFTYLNQ